MSSIINLTTYKNRIGYRPVLAIAVLVTVAIAGIAITRGVGAYRGEEMNAPNIISDSNLLQNSADKSKRSVPQADRPRNSLTAVNGQALLIEDSGKKIKVTNIKTSLPVFKAFGLSADHSKLLYSPLDSGRPSGWLFLEDLESGEREKITSRLVLSATMSPTDPAKIAYTFAGDGGFGLGYSDLNTATDKVLVAKDVFSELVQWGPDGNIRYFQTTAADPQLVINSPENNTFTWIGDRQDQDGDISLIKPSSQEKELALAGKTVTIGGDITESRSNQNVQGFPLINGDHRLPVDVRVRPTSGDGQKADIRSFVVRSPDGLQNISGQDLVGFNSLTLNDVESGAKIDLGNAILSSVSDSGVILKEFVSKGTMTKYVSWKGEVVVLGVTSVSYRLPMANTTMIQGGASYPSPGSCNLSAHFDTMGYAYDFQRTTVGSHALAMADGLVVFTHATMACNFIQASCPDYSPTGCPGFYLGNQVIIQHADGTYSAFSHLETNSIQVEVGTNACQGLYVGRQGHTGSVSGSFNSCGDHLHVQRQVSPDPSGQSVPITFADVASHPLSCGTGYSTSSTEIVHSIVTNSKSFPISGGSGTVSVTSNGCSWNALSNNSWITITAPSGGSSTGNGTVAYTVSDNSAEGARVGTMVIGGHIFTVSQAGGGVTNQAPTVSAGADQTVSVTTGASLSGTIVDDGLPNPPSAIVSTWSKVSGIGNVTFGDANSPMTTANFSLSGIYVLRLTASDGSLSASDDVKFIVNATAGGGMLVASPSVPSTYVDLTSEGSADWTHYGLADPTSVDRKSAVSPQIGDLTKLGSISTLRSSTNGDPTVNFNWSDGGPTAAGFTPSCIYTYGEGGGFEFSVPADTLQRTLKLYIGVWRVTGRLEAELSDGSSSPFVDTSFSTVYPSGAKSGLYSITYAASSPGQTLRLKWVIDSATYPVGNINIQAITLAGGFAPPTNNAPVVSAGSAQTITMPTSANLAGTASDDGLPNPPSTLTTTWSKVSGPGTVAFGNANALSTTATFSTSGTYVLRLTGSDSSLSTASDVTITVNSLGSGLLSASGSNTPTNVNLSSEGTADWAHWGLTSPNSFTHKSGITSQISNFTNVGGGSIQGYSNNPNFYSWTGGTPYASATNTPNAIYVIGVNNGFQVTIPADTTQRTLKMYVGLWSGNGRFEASLSDGSAPAYMDSSVANNGNTSNVVYTLDYKAATSGQSLTVKWTLNAALGPYSQYSNVTLQGATLAVSGTVVNQAPIASAGTAQTITLPSSANLSGSASDDGLPNPPAALTTTWSKVSGPGTVTFGNANALTTTASFSTSGTYVLRLTGSDSVLSTTSNVTITVNPAPVNQAPTVNAGSAQTLTLPSSANLSGSASDDGLPNPPAALTTTWSKVSGPGTVTFGNANALTTTASFSTSGTYVLRLTGSDSVLSTTSNVTINVNAAGSGSLAGSVAVTPTNVDLASLGTTDWAHWGLTSENSVTRKSGVTPQISNFSSLGSGTIQRYTNNPNYYSWTGGTPTSSMTNTPNAIYVIGMNNGFQITVPADMTPRTLKMYVGLWAAGGRFEAGLSDGSAPIYVDTSIISPNSTVNGVYTINYQAAAPGQTMTIKWTVNSIFNQWSNVTLQAATLF